MIDNDLSTPLLEVRAIIGDSAGEMISDQTLQALLMVYSDDVNLTSIKALEYIIADCAKRVDEEVGDNREWLSARYDQYKDLYDRLTKNPATSLNPALHIFGGVSHKEADRVNSNPDSRRIRIKESDDGSYRTSSWFIY